MNKNLLFSIFLLISISLTGQYRKYPAEISLGITGGKTGSMVYFMPAVAQTYLVGNQAGIIFRYISEKSLGLQTEINYSQRGWSDLDGLYAREMNYLEIPLMTHIYFGRKTRFYFNIGPKIGYLLNERTLLAQYTVEEYRHTQATSNKFDYGFCTGFGLSVQIKRQLFQLETRASYSLSNFFPDQMSSYYDNSNHLNASVTLGWLYKVK